MPAGSKQLKELPVNVNVIQSQESVKDKTRKEP